MDVILVKSDGMHVPAAAFVGVSYFRTVGVRRWAGDENRATVESREDHHFVSLLHDGRHSGGFATGMRYVNAPIGRQVLLR